MITTFKFIAYDDNLEEIIVAKATYKNTLKREGKIISRLAKEADKTFGESNWEQVPNYDISLNNLVGWYAREIDGYKTIEVQLF